MTGFVRAFPDKAGWFTPEDDPAQNRWYTVDLMKMSSSLPDDLGFVEPDQYAIFLPVLIQLAPPANSTPGDLPIVDPVDVKLRNNHLQYAVTWYGLALVLVVVSFLFYRSRTK